MMGIGVGGMDVAVAMGGAPGMVAVISKFEIVLAIVGGVFTCGLWCFAMTKVLT